jgi:hypothetical protein
VAEEAVKPIGINPEMPKMQSLLFEQINPTQTEARDPLDRRNKRKSSKIGNFTNASLTSHAEEGKRASPRESSNEAIQLVNIKDFWKFLEVFFLFHIGPSILYSRDVTLLSGLGSR